MTRSSRSSARSAPRVDAEAERVIQEIGGAAERRHANPSQVEQWVASPELREAAKLVSMAAGAHTVFERDSTPLLPPACSLPPVV